ncbi:MAG: Crp/Fnr family transcriptional regulator [Formivibrio sp.]|nr:Crp/Fnr family transcriptional regulator [Formivibrio sp.]
MDKASLLSGSSLFCELNQQELEELAQHAEWRNLPARKAVVLQGSQSQEMYAILRGRLKVIRESVDGREATLGILEPGEVFGELAMLDGEPRTATVETLEPCELLALRRNDVIGFLENHPKVMRQLILVLCQRLRSADNLVQDTLFLPLPQRLGKTLKSLAVEHGSDGLIDLKFTQQEIGNLVGASRESVNKQLNAWENEGWLVMEEGYLRLLSPEQLPG